MLKPISILHRICLVTILAWLAVTPARAEPKPERNYSYSDEAAAILEVYRKESDLPTKDLPKILALLDDGLAKIKDKKGYDYSMLLQLKAKTLIEKGDYQKSIEPMEQGLLLSDAATPTFLEERISSEVSHFLAQLYFQETSGMKDQARLKESYEKAELYGQRWLKNTPNPTAEDLYFYASLLFTRAVQDEKNVDKPRIKLAMDYIDRSMHLSSRPKDNLYVLKLACLQQLAATAAAAAASAEQLKMTAVAAAASAEQLEMTAASAEIFELLLQRKPESKEYWKQLASSYVQLDQPVRAIVTLERAQAVGLLNTPADNYSLFGIYFNEGQFEQAAELLEKGLKDKTIEPNDEKTWELLASCYQQLNRDFKAIDALKRAALVYPKSGQLEFLIAQAYYNLKKPEEALPHLQMSVRKGGGTKPAQTYIFMAYIAFELRNLDLALEAANKAIALPDGVKEGTRFKKAVEGAIADREEKLKKM